jgi:hypothetical protein
MQKKERIFLLFLSFSQLNLKSDLVFFLNYLVISCFNALSRNFLYCLNIGIVVLEPDQFMN